MTATTVTSLRQDAKVIGVVGTAHGVSHFFHLILAPLLFGAMMDARHPAFVFMFIGIFQVLAILTAVGVGANTARRTRQRCNNATRR